MKKLFYNPSELPIAVRLKSSILGVNKEYECHTGEGPVWMEELFRLAATDSFEIVEVNLRHTTKRTIVIAKTLLNKFLLKAGYRLRAIRTAADI